MKSLSNILVLLLLILRTPSTVSQYITVEASQQLFNSHVCGGCDWSGHTCQQNLSYLNSLANIKQLNLTQSPIINNNLKIRIMRMNILTTKPMNISFPNLQLKETSFKYISFSPIGINSTKGLIVYYHPTILGRYNAPSYAGDYIKALAAYYVFQGYTFVAGNYLGFQANQVRAYISYPQQVIRMTIFMLNDYISSLDKWYDQGQYPIFMIGYSEGAHYSLWAQKCLYHKQNCTYCSQKPSKVYLDTRFRYKKSIGLDGPYDLQGIVKPFLLSQVGIRIDGNAFQIQDVIETSLAKPSLSFLAIQSYATYSLKAALPIKSYFNQNFYNMDCSVPYDTQCLINGKKYNLVQAVSSVEAKEQLIFKAIGVSASSKTMKEYPFEYQLGYQNSIRSIVSQRIIDSAEFNETLAQATIIQFAKRAYVPTLVFTLEKDSIVSPNNTDNFVSQSNSNPEIKSIKFPNEKYKVCTLKNKDLGFTVDHGGAQFLGNLFAIDEVIFKD